RPIELLRFGPGEGSTQAGDLNLWLGDAPLEGPPGRWLVYREDPMARDLIEKKGEGLYQLTGNLDTQNTVEGHFARQLLPLLLSDPPPLERVGELDRRQMDPEQFRPRYTPPMGKGPDLRSRDISTWLL